MANDRALQDLFSNLAGSSSGELSFTATSPGALGKDVGMRLSRSSNPVYVFKVSETTGEQLTCVAFTLTVDGRSRVATRAEAFAKNLAVDGGRLFRYNPFLLVNDYAGSRLLAVSGIDLFGAFAQYASEHSIPYSASASFSLTPNFDQGKISMYAELQQPAVWASSTEPGALSTEDLIDLLRKVATRTAEQQDRIPLAVQAITERLDATPVVSSAGSATEAAPGIVTNETEYIHLEPEDEEVKIDDRIWNIILSAIESSPAVILVGPPGTGKSRLIRKAIGTISMDRQASGQPGIKRPLKATPDESWTARELIGGETISGDEIVFRPGWILRAIAEDRWLVLDEANRGDLDRIFGALLTWLAGEDVTVGVESSAEDARLIELGWTSGESHIEEIEATDEHKGMIRYLAGKNWRLLGTYNALDTQRVFRIGAALGRRFLRVPVPPISPSLFKQVLNRRADDLQDELLEKIGLLYEAHHEEEITTVGPAQFLAMCSYIRSAIRTRIPNSTSADSSVAASSATVDSILGEAYVLNLGTLLAQLEGRDFTNLIQRIRLANALPEEEIIWLSQVMRALA